MELHMKKTFSYLAITSCFVLGTTLAHADTDSSQGKMQEKMFKAMDANSDGMVTMDEFNAFHAKRFKELDVNGNGQITLEEMKAGYKKMDGSGHKKMDDAWHKKTDDAEGKKMEDADSKKTDDKD
jgi:Ca2+-binding EF-hand superfamily protein